MGFLTEHRTFWREFRGSFHTTGAALPSGKSLGRSLARFVAANGSQPKSMRILEVGPGTGAVTRQIVRAMDSDATLDMVELNNQFVESLRRQFELDPALRSVQDRSQIIHKSVEEIAEDSPYDVVISGLPLNNFAVEDVRSILAKLRRLTAPGGTVSFFEYIAVRSVKVLVSRSQQRERLRGVGAALAEVLDPFEFRRDAIWANVPPAWVHHLRFDGDHQ